jgi:serine/threonine protein kinase
MSSQILKTEEEFENSLQNLISCHNIVEFNKRDFVEGNKLGQGGFGKVISASYLSMKCAIKKIREYHPKEIFRELYIMRKYTHPSIPGLYGIIKHPLEKKSKIGVIEPQKLTKFEENVIEKSVHKLSDEYSNETNRNTSSKNVTVCQHKYDIDFVLEVIEGDTLEKLLKKVKFTEIEKLLILLNFATVLDYLHDEKIIHRDLRQEI